MRGRRKMRCSVVGHAHYQHQLLSVLSVGVIIQYVKPAVEGSVFI